MPHPTTGLETSGPVLAAPSSQSPTVISERGTVPIQQWELVCLLLGDEPLLAALGTVRWSLSRVDGAYPLSGGVATPDSQGLFRTRFPLTLPSSESKPPACSLVVESIMSDGRRVARGGAANVRLDLDASPHMAHAVVQMEEGARFRARVVDSGGSTPPLSELLVIQRMGRIPGIKSSEDALHDIMTVIAVPQNGVCEGAVRGGFTEFRARAAATSALGPSVFTTARPGEVLDVGMVLAPSDTASGQLVVIDDAGVPVPDAVLKLGWRETGLQRAGVGGGLPQGVDARSGADGIIPLPPISMRQGVLEAAIGAPHHRVKGIRVDPVALSAGPTVQVVLARRVAILVTLRTLGGEPPPAGLEVRCECSGDTGDREFALQVDPVTGRKTASPSDAMPFLLGGRATVTSASEPGTWTVEPLDAGLQVISLRVPGIPMMSQTIDSMSDSTPRVRFLLPDGRTVNLSRMATSDATADLQVLRLHSRVELRQPSGRVVLLPQDAPAPGASCRIWVQTGVAQIEARWSVSGIACPPTAIPLSMVNESATLIEPTLEMCPSLANAGRITLQLWRGGAAVPIAGVPILLQSIDGTAPPLVPGLFTDASGKVEMALPPGKYRAYPALRGIDTNWVRLDVSPSDSRTVHMTLGP